MTARLLVTFGILLYAFAVPVLEVNATHLLNPYWVAHARLHEAWQLATNTSIGLLSLWLAWRRNEIRIPAFLTFTVAGGFLVAYALRDAYGGSMRHTDGSELTALGFNVGVIGFGVAVALAAIALVLARNSRAPSERET
jgi:hypothetical protein